MFNLLFLSNTSQVDKLPLNNIYYSKESGVLKQIGYRIVKRLFDFFFSLLFIVFILSWLYPVLAIIIKIQSPGPVLFKQLRTGQYNSPFICYKFRTMRVNRNSDLLQASRVDDRITLIGKILRKTSIDETPQFFNVLLGNMSVIGPRPHMILHTEKYSKLIDRYMDRHLIKPGVSGWAQTNGYRGETKHVSLMEKRVEYDIWYLENRSFLLDVKIVLLTLVSVLKRDEAAF